MTFYNIYLNCPLCGQLYSAVSYPKYEDGMIICPCTEESTRQEKARQHHIELERAALNPVPPDTCPMCHAQALAPKKDEYDRWTWDCAEGCNP